MLLRMAWRNIWRNRWRSLVIMLSVAIGLFAGLAVLSLYKGMMRSRIRTLIETETGHIQLHDSSFKKDMDPVYTLKDPDQLNTYLNGQPEISGYALRSLATGMLASASGSAGVQLLGVQAAAENAISRLGDKIKTGHLFDTTGKAEILIGKKLAKKLKLKTGSRVVLTFTDTSTTMVSAAFKVAGIYESDNAPLDERNVYMPLPLLNNLLQIGNHFHEVSLRLSHDESVDDLVSRLRKHFPGYQIESWKDLSPETDLMTRTVDEMSYLIIIIILIALSFGIINTMLMAILERTREIGMMIALGTTRYRIFMIILLETLLLTLAGTPVGILIALLAIGYYHQNGLDLSGMGKEMMSSFGFETMIYPEFPFEKMAGVMTIVMITALAASLFPSINALRLQPADALKK